MGKALVHLIFLSILFLAPADYLTAEETDTQADREEAVLVVEEPSEEETATVRVRDFNEFYLTDSLRLTLHGDLWLYSVHTHDDYHQSNVQVGNSIEDSDSSFTEVTARIGADLVYEDFLGLHLRAVGTSVWYDPDTWTYPRDTREWNTRFDLANISLTGDMGDIRTTTTIGLQELQYGDGMLIYDGYSEKYAKWTTPMRSFPAVKMSMEIEQGYTLDLFSAMVHDHRVSYEAYLGSGTGIRGGGGVTGANLSGLDEEIGKFDIGLFFKFEDIDKADNNNLDTNSNTWALSFRDEKKIGDILFTGELVRQWGRTKVERNTCTGERHHRRSWGANFTARYDFDDTWGKPYVKGRYAWFQGDRPTTRSMEGFDPFYYGFGDWSYWYMGDMSSYSLYNTNLRAYILESGFEPTEKTMLRLLFYDLSFDQMMDYSGSASWSNEINLVFDYSPCDYAFFGCMVGAVLPGSAASKFYETNMERASEIQTEFMVWGGIKF